MIRSTQYCHHSNRVGQDSTAVSTHTRVHPPDAPTDRSAGRNQRTLQGNYGDRSSGYWLWFLFLRRKSAEAPKKIPPTECCIPQYEATCRYFSQPVYPHSNRDLIQSIDSDLRTVPWPALLLAGGIAGVAGWLTTFPFDLVKTRIQTTSASQSGRGFFQGGGITISTFVRSWKNGGLRVFSRGLAPTLIRYEFISTVKRAGETKLIFSQGNTSEHGHLWHFRSDHSRPLSTTQLLMIHPACLAHNIYISSTPIPPQSPDNCNINMASQHLHTSAPPFSLIELQRDPVYALILLGSPWSVHVIYITPECNDLYA